MVMAVEGETWVGVSGLACVYLHGLHRCMYTYFLKNCSNYTILEFYRLKCPIHEISSHKFLDIN